MSHACVSFPLHPPRAAPLFKSPPALYCAVSVSTRSLRSLVDCASTRSLRSLVDCPY